MKYNSLHLFIAVLWAISLLLDIIANNLVWLAILHLSLLLLYLETGAHPIARGVGWIRQQIEFYHEAKRRRVEYEQFKADVKSGLVEDGEFEAEARRVVE